MTNVDIPTFNILSLCSGVGAFDLGMRLAIPNSRTVAYVEIEAACNEVLVSRFKDRTLDEAPIWTNLRTFNGQPWRGTVDCIIGGYPCQPFSIAGKKAGTNDPRHLWPDISRIIQNISPEWCFFENVANHLNIGYQQVRTELEELGYRVTQGLFTAEEVGAPHRRERLFILGHSNGPRSSRRGLHTSECTDKWVIRETSSALLANPECTRITTSFSEWCSCITNHRNNLRKKYDTSGGTTLDVFPPRPNADAEWNRIISRNPEFAPATTTTVESTFRGMVDGLANRVDRQPESHRIDRLRAVGNGVVPQTVAYAFHTLLKDLL